MAKTIKPSKISIALLVGSLVIVSHTPPANAAWFRKDTYLGLMTTSDNVAYWRAQWKYGRDNVWGQAASWLGPDTWKTKCYRWRWF